MLIMDILLEREEDIIIQLKEKLDVLVDCVSEIKTLRQKFYLEKINRLINVLEMEIDDLTVDLSSNSINETTWETIEEMKQYIINEKVKEKFLPYMMVYHMILNQNYEGISV